MPRSGGVAQLLLSGLVASRHWLLKQRKLFAQSELYVHDSLHCRSVTPPIPGVGEGLGEGEGDGEGDGLGEGLGLGLGEGDGDT